MAPGFHKATPDDVLLVASIIDRSYEHYIPVLGGRKPRPMTDDHLARIRNGETFLLDDEGVAVGVTSMYPADGALHIFNIAILPEAQGRGLLRRVFAFAEDLARSADLPRLTLFTNALMERNRAIYEHLGFTELRQEDAPGGYRIVFLQRLVVPSQSQS